MVRGVRRQRGSPATALRPRLAIVNGGRQSRKLRVSTGWPGSRSRDSRTASRMVEVAALVLTPGTSDGDLKALRFARSEDVLPSPRPITTSSRCAKGSTVDRVCRASERVSAFITNTPATCSRFLLPPASCNDRRSAMGTTAPSHIARYTHHGRIRLAAASCMRPWPPTEVGCVRPTSRPPRPQTRSVRLARPSQTVRPANSPRLAESERKRAGERWR